MLKLLPTAQALQPILDITQLDCVVPGVLLILVHADANRFRLVTAISITLQQGSLRPLRNKFVALLKGVGAVSGEYSLGDAFC